MSEADAAEATPAVDPAPEPTPAAPDGSAPGAEPAVAASEPDEGAQIDDLADDEETSPEASDEEGAADAVPPCPDGCVEVEHDDPSAVLVVAGLTYTATEAGRFFVRMEHLALAHAHGFRAPAVEVDHDIAA